MKIKYLLLNVATGEGKKGVWFSITLICEFTDENGKSKATTCTFFVNSEIYDALADCPRFTEVDAVIIPSNDGKARLISALPL